MTFVLKTFRLWKVAVLGALVAYLVFHLIQGNRGLLALVKIQKIVQEEQTTLADLERQSTVLLHHIRLLRPQNLDLDLLDECARIGLNVAESDEMILDTEEILASVP